VYRRIAVKINILYEEEQHQIYENIFNKNPPRIRFEAGITFKVGVQKL